MQLSQPTLEPHSRVILVEYKFYTHSCFFYTSFGYVPLLLSFRWRGWLHQRFRWFLGASSPSRRPCGALPHVFILRFRILVPILVSVCYKMLFNVLYAFICDMCCDILIILLYICVTWSWRIYDCSVYVLYKPGVTSSSLYLWGFLLKAWREILTPSTDVMSELSVS